MSLPSALVKARWLGPSPMMNIAVGARMCTVHEYPGAKLTVASDAIAPAMNTVPTVTRALRQRRPSLGPPLGARPPVRPLCLSPEGSHKLLGRGGTVGRGSCARRPAAPRIGD